jgi:hypothetical protein
VACKEGCSWCCRQKVCVTVPEVLHLTECVRTTFSAEQLADLRSRLAALDDVTREMDVPARAAAGLPCALLVNDRCSAYAARPVKCPTWYSFDARGCERGDEARVPVYPVVIGDGVQAGLSQGLAQAGLSGDTLELTAALRIALDTPDAAERYLAGEPVFAPAKAAR